MEMIQKERWISMLLIIIMLSWVNQESDRYCPITAFRHLKTTENDVHIKIKDFFQTIKKHIYIAGLTIPFKDLKLAGSSQEGCFSPRFFEEDKDFTDGIHRMVELDLEITLFEITDNYKHCFEDIVGKPGFVKINVADRQNCIPNHVKDLHWIFKMYETIDDFITGGYINSYRVKEVYSANMRFGKQHKYTHTVEILAAFLTNRPLSQIQTTNAMFEISKAVSTFSWNVTVNNKLYWKVSSDFAMVIQLDWIPPILENYKNRTKNWPPMDEIEDEMKAAYVIAKPSNEERKNPKSTEFRYSFAMLERKLVSLQSANQRHVYLIFKSIIYKWIKPIDPSKISSFIAKNVMLWTCERIKPSDSFWDDDVASITTALTYMFGQLQQMFEAEFMPYIFIPEINVLQHLSSNTLKIVAQIAQKITNNPLDFMAIEDIEKVTNILQNMLNVFHTIDDIVEDIQTYGPNILMLKRPDLFNLRLKYIKECYENFNQKDKEKSTEYNSQRPWEVFFSRYLRPISIWKPLVS